MSTFAGVERLDRRLILEAALKLVDEKGANALTMRGLAAALGVGTMSLYTHVRGRQDLLDGLSAVLVDRIGVRFGEDPEASLRRLAGGIRQVARDHPAAFQLVGMRPLRTAPALRVVDAGLGAMRGLGLDGEVAVNAYRVLVSFVRGFALSEIANFTLQHSVPEGLQPNVHPHASELATTLAAADLEPAFAIGVDLLVAGFVEMGRAR